MKEFIKQNKILIIIFVTLLIFEIAAGFLYLSLIKKKASNSIAETPIQEESLVTEEEPQTNTDLNILLLGMGGEGHSGGMLSDSITLVNIKPEVKKVNVISIPRDLWVPIPTDWDKTSLNKINAAYAIGIDSSVKYPNKKPEYRGSLGGGNLSKQVVGNVTGIKSKYFIAVNFAKFTEIIDLLGGIEVNVEKPFDDYFYPVKGLENETCGISPEKIAEFHQKYSGFDLEKQFTCRYEHLHFEKGKINMDGTTALKFVRSRHSEQNGGDFARSERQHEVLNAIKEKILSKNILSSGNKVLEKLFASVTTDIDIKILKDVLSSVGNIQEYKINHIYINEENVLVSSKSSNGQYILQPKGGQGNFQEIIKYISEKSK